ncbi:hypothetical protein ANN_14914 [Periplaneta americana]|uniref:Reverse transcriptase domain-containing protein n=1 Tax=Periplaneta americana TaxID=6978 RepID=A0ABQ8SZT1_PERAM|nr:hypothetical protein ANN_14914 [Periplaneta americana]
MVTPVLMCGCENWVLNKPDKRKTQRAVIRLLRRIEYTAVIGSSEQAPTFRLLSRSRNIPCATRYCEPATAGQVSSSESEHCYFGTGGTDLLFIFATVPRESEHTLCNAVLRARNSWASEQLGVGTLLFRNRRFRPTVHFCNSSETGTRITADSTKQEIKTLRKTWGDLLYEFAADRTTNLRNVEEKEYPHCYIIQAVTFTASNPANLGPVTRIMNKERRHKMYSTADGIQREPLSSCGRQRVKVRTGEEMLEGSEIRRRVQQGCILSPALFNIYLEDLMKNCFQDMGGVIVRGRRIDCITFADDMALLAE